MKIYVWFYPDTAHWGEAEYTREMIARLRRLRATGVFCMAHEGTTLADPRPTRDFLARCQEAGLDFQLGFVPFSEPPDPTPEILRRRYTYFLEGERRYRGLCPAWPANRLLAIERATRLLEAVAPPALHLDYIRYFFANNPAFGVDLEWEDGRKWIDTYLRCQCPLCQTERLELLGREPTLYDYLHPGYIARRLRQRAEHVDEVLLALRRLTEEYKMRLTAAVRVQYLNRALIEGQDWIRWAEEGWAEALCPMNYATDLETVERRFRDNWRLLGRRQVEIWEGLARRSSAGENSPQGLLAQARRVREIGADGVALFHLGVLTEEDFQAWERVEDWG